MNEYPIFGDGERLTEVISITRIFMPWVTIEPEALFTGHQRVVRQNLQKADFLGD
jgi:hypothetical protein